MLVDVRTKVAAARRARKSLAQIKAANPAKRYEVAGGFIMADAFVETVYESIGPRRR
jgi:hypothetical protein